MADELQDSDSSGVNSDVTHEIAPSQPEVTQHDKQPQKQPQQQQQKSSKHEGQKGLKASIINIYDHQYKKLLIIPAIVIIIAVAILLTSYSKTGSFFKKDISLSGGVSIIAVTDYSDQVTLQSEMAQRFPDADVSVRTLSQVGKNTGLVVEGAIQSDSEVNDFISFLSSKLNIPASDFTVQKVGASLGASFFQQLIKGMIFAFVFMAITVFIYFKIVSGKWLWLPGIFVVWTAFVDILCTLAVVSFSGIHVSAAGLAAFLMLVGYSVDTDILLTVRALKSNEPTLAERVRSAVRTGVLMSLTAFGAVIAGYFFAQAETIKQIMFILSIGMIFDIVHTWLTNASLLKWFLHKQGVV